MASDSRIPTVEELDARTYTERQDYLDALYSRTRVMDMPAAADLTREVFALYDDLAQVFIDGFLAHCSEDELLASFGQIIEATLLKLPISDVEKILIDGLMGAEAATSRKAVINMLDSAICQLRDDPPNYSTLSQSLLGSLFGTAAFTAWKAGRAIEAKLRAAGSESPDRAYQLPLFATMH